MRKAMIVYLISIYKSADAATRESIVEYAAEIMPSDQLLNLWNFATRII